MAAITIRLPQPGGPPAPKPDQTVHNRSLVFVLDTETTGFAGAPNTRVLQLGVVAVERDTGRLVSSLSLLVNPDVWDANADKAALIHGITKVKAREGVSQAAGWDKWMNWLVTLNTRPPYTHGNHVLAAWNSKFDAAVMRDWRARLYPNLAKPPSWPTWAVAGRYPAAEGCLMRAYEAYMTANGLRGSKKLTEASQYFGLGKQDDIHDALKDAKMAAQVWCCMEGYDPNLVNGKEEIPLEAR